MDCSPPGSLVHGILQARILGWVAISFFRGCSQPRDRIRVSCTSRRILYHLSPNWVQRWIQNHVVWLHPLCSIVSRIQANLQRGIGVWILNYQMPRVYQAVSGREMFPGTIRVRAVSGPGAEESLQVQRVAWSFVLTKWMIIWHELVSAEHSMGRGEDSQVTQISSKFRQSLMRF